MWFLVTEISLFDPLVLNLTIVLLHSSTFLANLSLVLKIKNSDNSIQQLLVFICFERAVVVTSSLAQSRIGPKVQSIIQENEYLRLYICVHILGTLAYVD